MKAHPTRPATTELRLLLPGHRLDPAERLFDALADALTAGIAAVPRRARDERALLAELSTRVSAERRRDRG